MTERLARWVGRQALEYTYVDIATMDDEYETRIKTRVANLGVDPSTLEQAFDSGEF